MYPIVFFGSGFYIMVTVAIIVAIAIIAGGAGAHSTSNIPPRVQTGPRFVAEPVQWYNYYGEVIETTEDLTNNPYWCRV